MTSTTIWAPKGEQGDKGPPGDKGPDGNPGASGGYANLGNYGPGLVFDGYAQTFTYAGNFYTPGPEITTFPYVTTGEGAVEIAKFRNIGDAQLRSDLLDEVQGAGIVAFDAGATYPANTVGKALQTGSLFARSPLSTVISTVVEMLNTVRVNIWEFANLVTVKPTPANPNTWDWTPAVQAAANSVAPVGTIDFTEGVFKFSGVTTSGTISLAGRGAGATSLENFAPGGTIIEYDQTGMSDKERRNWLTFSALTLRDEASFTGIGIKTSNVLSLIFRDCYIRDFKLNYGLQILEALWVYLDNTNSDLCELNFVSTQLPHFNNVICIRGGEIRNPTPGRSGIYVEGGDIIHLMDATIEGDQGGAGYVSGGKFKNIKMLSIDNTYFEVLPRATQGGLVLENCQAVTVGRSQLNSQSQTVPSVLCIDSDVVEFNRCSMVAFPLRSTGVNSIKLDGCMFEGPMDISAGTALDVVAPMPYNTRAVLVVDPSRQARPAGKPKPYRNSYADSAFDSAAPGVTVVSGAPVSSRDTTRGYFGANSWRVTGVAGDSIRANNLGVTTSNGQSGCFSFMAKADSPGRFTLTNFLSGAAGGHDIYLSTEWRRYFAITNLDPTSITGDSYLLQLAFQGTNAFNITDIQFIPFTDYGEIPGLVDGFNYIPTHGAIQSGAVSKEVAAAKNYFDRGINFRKMTTAPVGPEDGDVYYADGTGWNPGAGAGLYWYNGAVYAKL